jgi:Helix-turn-helix domain
MILSGEHNSMCLRAPKEESEMKPLVTTAQAAPLMGLAVGTLENWRCLGIGPKFIKCGRRVMYDPDDIAAWREKNRVRSTSEA